MGGGDEGPCVPDTRTVLALSLPHVIGGRRSAAECHGLGIQEAWGLLWLCHYPTV